MAIKSFNPTTPSRRHMTVMDRSDLTKKAPERSLTFGKKSTGGRRAQGLEIIPDARLAVGIAVSEHQTIFAFGRFRFSPEIIFS